MSDLMQQAEALLAGGRPSSPSAAPGQNFLPPATRRDVPGQHAPSPVWRAGQGNPTLFVHGWDDTHRIWRRFAQHFLQNQMPLLLMDLPAHGASKADVWAWPFAGQSVREVCAAEGPVDAIIAHSFGCIAAARAVALGAAPEYLVLIAPPLDPVTAGWAKSARDKGAAENVIACAAEMFKAETGFAMDGFDAAAALQTYEGRILIIGSSADAQCPLPAMHHLAAEFPGAVVHEVHGISHRDLALDTDVLKAILNFLGYPA
jgi:pimeloyl-ACP methyl ester carboxylesterase